jgi:phage-related minor tail protein
MAFPDICRAEFTNWTAIQNQIAALKSAKDAALRALKDAPKSARDLVSRGFDEALNDLARKQKAAQDALSRCWRAHMRRLK